MTEAVRDSAESALVERFSREILLRGPVPITLAVIALSVLVGLGFASLTAGLWADAPRDFHILLTLCVLVPVIVVPPIVWIAAGIALEGDSARREAERLAVIDPLTGLCNRRHLMELAERELQRARRSSLPLALLVLDIDRFKAVNDGHGHAAGDEVLKQVAPACAGCVRDRDTVARLGGEEFVVLLPETPEAEALRLAERMRAGVEALRVAVSPTAFVGPTLSIGVAWSTDDDTASDRLIDRADRAMYEAKRAGRNRVYRASAEGLAVAALELP